MGVCEGRRTPLPSNVVRLRGGRTLQLINLRLFWLKRAYMQHHEHSMCVNVEVQVDWESRSDNLNSAITINSSMSLIKS